MIIQVIAFVTGTVVTSRIPVLPPVEACLVLVPLLVFGLHTRLSTLCACLLGVAWCFLALNQETEHRQTLSYAGDVQTLVGVVEELPVKSSLAVRFMFRLDDTNVRLRLYWYQPDHIPESGQRWRFQVRLKEPTGSVNFDAFDYERWLFTKRIHGLGHVVPGAEHELLEVNLSFDRFRHDLKRYLEARIPDQALGTFLALSIGDTSQLRPSDWHTLNSTGTTHLLVVSGLHVGLIASLIFLLCRSIGLNYVAAAMLTAASATLYAFIAGWGLPVQRALVMTLVYLGCGLLNRNISLLSRLALAALFVVIFDPLATLSPGFWLSFGVVGSLILALSNRGASSKLDGAWRSQWVAFIGLLPFLAGFNHQLPLVSLIVNLIAIPVVGFVLVPLIFLSVIANLLSEGLGHGLVVLTHQVTAGLWHFLEFASSRDWLLHIVAPANWQIGLAMTGAFVLLTPKGLLPRWLGIPMMLMLLAPVQPLSPGLLKMTFFDVGQGMSVLLETGSGVTLYDTGPAIPDVFSAAEQIVLPGIRRKGWSSLDQFIISHTDNDHAGGKDAVLQSMPVRRLIEQGDCLAEWQRDDIWFYSFDVEGSASSNDSSCLLLIVSGQRRVLLTGDIETAGEYALLRKFSLPVDVLSVPHHGSDSSSSPALLNALLPELAVVSAGYRNRFGHPHEPIIERYESRAVRVLKSAETGALEIMLEPNGMMVREARREPAGIWRRREP